MEVYIIMRKSLLKLDTDELLQKDDPPTPQRIVEFIDSSLPIGMGGFVLGSKLYFAGGEKIKKGFALRNSYNTSKVLKYEDDNDSDWPGLNSKVFLFQPSASSSAILLTLMHKISPMNQPKTKPMVAAVEGKIYILSSKPYVLRDNKDIYPSPFECLDPITNTWEVLPEPPNFSSHRCAHNLKHLFVSGSRIFVKNPLGIQFFDVHARRWFEKKEGLAELQIDKSVCSKWMGWVSLAEGDEGIAIAYAHGQGLVGYEYETDPATTIRREQLLDKVNERLPSATSCDEGCEEGFVQHLGDNRFCFIVSVRKKESPWCVPTFIFEVTRVGLDGPCFLDIQLLREHCYDFMKLTSFDFGSIQDVVFMHKSQKKGKMDERSRDSF